MSNADDECPTCEYSPSETEEMARSLLRVSHLHASQCVRNHQHRSNCLFKCMHCQTAAPCATLHALWPEVTR